MTRVIVLDSEPLGLVTNPKANPDSLACNLWLENWLDAEARVLIPGIADYEVRRELIRANKRAGLQRLDDFRQALEFVPITQERRCFERQTYGLPCASRENRPPVIRR
jgi:hypothetical protein